MPVVAYRNGLDVPCAAVFGLYSDDRLNWLFHVGLADAAHTLQDQQPALWFHIWPATDYFGADYDFTHQFTGTPINPNVIGYIDDLTADETEMLLNAMSHLSTLVVTFPGGYIDESYPAYERILVAGRYQYRFTCVGVVLWCYDDAGLSLLDMNHPNYPQTSLGRGATQRYAAPGYLFHALARSTVDSRLPDGRYRAYCPNTLREAYYSVQP